MGASPKNMVNLEVKSEINFADSFTVENDRISPLKVMDYFFKCSGA